MKRLITLLSLLFVASMAASAQYITEKPNSAKNLFPGKASYGAETTGPLTPIVVQDMPNGQIVEFRNAASRELFNMQNVEINNLLERENRLLSQRNAALITTLSASAVSTVFLSFRDSRNQIPTACQVIGTTGAIISMASAVWLVVNEFQLISTRKKINSSMQVRLFPNGLKIEF